MKAQSVLQKQLNALSASIAEILTNPDASYELKTQLEVFLYTCRQMLSQKAKQEIEILELKLLVPEVLSRL